MSDVPVFVLANLSVNDADEYRKYEKGFFPILKRHGGQLLTFDDKIETLEGNRPPNGRVVILQFPNEKSAHNWWQDPEYQALSEHRRRGTTLHFLTLVHGLSPRV